MKKITWYSKIISIVLAVVIIVQPLSVTAQGNTSVQKSIVNSANSVNLVNLIKAENISGNFRELKITFNKPVRFVDGQPSLHIFAGNFISTDTKVKDSWQDCLAQGTQSCVAVDPVKNNGVTYATSYDLTFTDDLKKDGIVKIVDDIKNNVESSSDTISSVCDMNGNLLTSNDQENSMNIATTEYTIYDRMVSVSVPAPNKAVIAFNYDTDFIVNNPCDYIYADDNSGTGAKISATSYEKIDSKDYSFTFSDNLPANGEIKLEEKVNDGDGFLNTVAQASDGSKLEASITDSSGYDADSLTFNNPWIYVIKADYIDKNEARIYFSAKAKFNTPDLASTVFATEKLDPNSTDGWKVTAKSITPVDGTITDGASIYDVTFNSNVTEDSYIQIIGNITSSDTNNLSTYIYTPDGKSIYTDNIMNVPDNSSSSKTNNMEKLGTIAVAYKIPLILLDGRISGENKAVIKFNVPTDFNVVNPADSIYASNGTSVQNAATSFTKIDGQTYEITFNGKLAENDTINIRQNANDTITATDGRPIISSGILTVQVKNYATLVKAEVIDANNKYVRLTFSIPVHINSKLSIANSPDADIWQAGMDTTFSPIYEDKTTINGIDYATSIEVKFGDITSVADSKQIFNNDIIPNSGCIRMLQTDNCVVDSDNEQMKANFVDKNKESVIFQSYSLDTVSVPDSTNVDPSVSDPKPILPAVTNPNPVVPPVPSPNPVVPDPNSYLPVIPNPNPNNENTQTSSGSAKTYNTERIAPTMQTMSLDGNFTFDEGSGTITKYNGTDTSVTIPSQIDGYDVTSIGDYAFASCSFSSITIPSTVMSIGYEAFGQCKNLTSITIPDSVTSLGAAAFYFCTKLTSITISNSLTSIECAFDGCTALTSITIPSGVTDIRMAFANCTSLASIIIPNGVTNIDYAFEECTALASVSIPDSVKSIGAQTFYDCGSLTSVSIPNYVTEIGYDAFYNCTKLTAITIPNDVTSLDYGAFSYCTKLTSITLPDGVSSTGDYTFDGCTALSSVTIPTNVTTIGYGAFRGCTALTDITIPSSVKSIDEWAFEGCTTLIGITIPDGVTDIGNETFEGCTALTSITIPDSVMSIDIWAFNDCPNLVIYCSYGSEALIYAVDNSINYGVIQTSVIMINPYTLTPTNQDITVTASTSVGTLNTTSYTFTENGSYTFTETDSNGIVTNKIVTISNIDKTPPTISLTCQAGIISATISDDQCNNVVQKWAYGEQSTAYFASEGNLFTGSSFIATQNGIYSVYAIDNAGNESVQEITVTDADTTAPTCTFSHNSADWTNNDISVTVTPSDSGSGVGQWGYVISSDNGATWGDWIDCTGSTNVTIDLTANGIYKIDVYAVDNANNAATIISGTYLIDKGAPTIYTEAPTTWGNTNTVLAVAWDDISGIAVQKWAAGDHDASYFASNGTEFDKLGFTVSANDDYTVYVRDLAGNETVQIVTVDHVDATVPTVPTFGTSATLPTNGDVTLTIDYDASATTELYKIGSGEWAPYTGSLTITENTTVYARAVNSSGNSTDSSYEISNIDESAPDVPTINDNTDNVTIDSGADNGSPSSVITNIIGISNFTFTGDAWTTTTAKYFSGSYTNGSSYTNNSIGDNGTTYSQFTVNVPDNAIQAQISFYYSVSSEYGSGFFNVYIDGIQVVNASGEIDWTLFQQALSAGSHTIKFEYTKDDSSIWGLDSAFIDGVWFSYSIPDSYSSGIAKTQYKIDDGSWIDYTGEIDDIDRSDDHTIYARTIDNAGNISDVVSEDLPCQATDGSSNNQLNIPPLNQLTLTAPTNLSVQMISDDGIVLTWNGPYFFGFGIFKIYLNGNLYAETTFPIYDIKGLTKGTTYSFTVSAYYDGIESAKSKALHVTNVNTVFASGFTPGTTLSVVSQNIDIASNQIFAYYPDGTQLNTTDLIGTGTRIIIMDGAYIVNTYIIVIFGDINGDGAINLSDLVSIRDYLLGNTTIAMGSASELAGDLYGEGNITLNDLVGMMAYVSGSGRITQRIIGNIAPEIATFIADKTTPTNNDVYVTINYPSDAVVKKYSIDYGTTWYDYTTAVEFTTNGTVLAESQNAAGNWSDITSYDVTNIVQFIFDGAGTITGYTGTDTSIIIPSSINGVAVACIGDGAFNSCDTITDITIPSSVTSIGACAFSGCSSLASIIILGTVTSIGGAAFDGTPWLNNYPSDYVIVDGILIKYKGTDSTITIPNNVTTIGDGAFAFCSSLISVTIQSGVTSIGDMAFSYCDNLKYISIPYGVKTIGDGAFNWCSSLLNFTIPGSVTSIGACAFSGCSSLTSISIPNSVTSIGDGAFSGCTLLTSVTILASVTSISDSEFSGCSSLESINIPNNISSIGDYAFADCTLLISISITSTNKLSSIGEGAFDNCNLLASINNIENVTSIGAYAFSGCTSLASITIPNISVINDYTFNNCFSLSSITIPTSVSSIGDYAFADCTALTSSTSFTIPASILIIGDGAFYNCNSLSDVTLLDGTQSIGSQAFAFCGALTSVTIPDSVNNIGDSAFICCFDLAIYCSSDSYADTYAEDNGITVNAPNNNNQESVSQQQNMTQQVQNQPTLAQLTNTYVTGTMNVSEPVYSGPSSSIYYSVGSTSVNDSVYIFWIENGWYYIEYPTSNGDKRGYVPLTYTDSNDNTTNSFTNNPSSIPAVNYSGGYYDYNNDPVNTLSVYYQPSTTGLPAGTVYPSEGVTVLGKVTINGVDYAYIEYSASATKRGFVLLSSLASTKFQKGDVASLNSNADVYSGPCDQYASVGSIDASEYVVVLAKNSTCAFVEYNSILGARKRGYIPVQSLNLKYTNWVDNIDTEIDNRLLAYSPNGQTVYSGPDTHYYAIGSIFDNDQYDILGNNSDISSAKDGWIYIEYYTGTSASKRGYIPIKKSDGTNNYFLAPEVSIPGINAPDIGVYGVPKIRYGTSGDNRPLYAYKIGSGPNVIFSVFEQHGFEDAWAADGIELVKIGDSLVSSTAAYNSNGLMSNWTVYIIPSANPDGLLNGWTNNGPGRCTCAVNSSGVISGFDMNRSYPISNFTANTDPYNSRNYTGNSSLGSPENKALCNFISNFRSHTAETILLDVHGWQDTATGDPQVSQYFANQLGLSVQADNYNEAYLVTWGLDNGIRSSMIELPMPSSSQDIINRNFSGKFTTAFENILSNNLGVSDSNMLQLNSSGEEVEVLQAYLKNAGYYKANVDGSFGNVTYNAVVSFQTVCHQTDNKVIIDGIVGRQTWGKMGFPTDNNGEVIRSSGQYQSYSQIALNYIIPVTGVNLSSNSISMDFNAMQQLCVTISPANASQNIIWSSDNNNIATVDSNGVIHSNNSDGIATITAKSAVNNSISATCMVTVSDVSNSKIFKDSDGNVYTRIVYKNGGIIINYKDSVLGINDIFDANILKADMNGLMSENGANIDPNMWYDACNAFTWAKNQIEYYNYCDFTMNDPEFFVLMYERLVITVNEVDVLQDIVNLGFAVCSAVDFGLSSVELLALDTEADFVVAGGSIVLDESDFNVLDEAADIVPADYLQGVLEAYEGIPEVETLSSDLTVYRYWGNGSSETGSPWFTTVNGLTPSEARAELALPNVNTAVNITKFKIPAGTEILTGEVKSMVGDPDFGSYAVGGGTQIYLPNPSDAIKIN